MGRHTVSMTELSVGVRMSQDARTARAEAKASKARAKSLRPWYKKKRVLIPLAILVLVVLIATLGGGASEDDGGGSGSQVQSLSGNKDNPPAADAEVTDCHVDSSVGSVEAVIEITNNSSKRSDYTIEVAFEDGSGTLVGNGYASASNVEPDQKARDVAVDFAEGDGITCKITDVNRFASN